jgi:hypothetical protein
MVEPEEDFACGVSLRRKLEHEGWLRYARTPFEAEALAGAK